MLVQDTKEAVLANEALKETMKFHKNFEI